ncbi:hypothetical protein SLA2020_311130 [Shorea laevis]
MTPRFHMHVDNVLGSEPDHVFTSTSAKSSRPQVQVSTKKVKTDRHERRRRNVKIKENRRDQSQKLTIFDPLIFLGTLHFFFSGNKHKILEIGALDCLIRRTAYINYQAYGLINGI